jgi:CheY-like chemotaxis protein
MARILVIDDDPDILGLVRVLLRRRGYDVDCASSAHAALELLAEQGCPNLALIDVTMPGMDGLELVRILREREDTRALPVIFLSARVLPEDIEAGRSLGAGYITKPFDASALLDEVDEVVAAPDRVSP